MDWLTIIGLVAATCTTAALLPQVLKTVRTRQTRDISLLMYSLFTVGIVLWLIYGLMLNNVPLITANSVTLVLATAVLLLKIKYG
jgi:MtN3 and saliva related transmembrane protein